MKRERHVTTVAITMQPELIAWLDKEAGRLGLTRSRFVRELLQVGIRSRYGVDTSIAAPEGGE